MEEMELFSIVYLVVTLIAVIVFFVMAYNISKIKTMIAPSKDNWQAEYKKWKFFGDHDKALVALKNYYWEDRKERFNGLTTEEKPAMEKNMRQWFEADFKSVGGEYPNPPVEAN